MGENALTPGGGAHSVSLPGSTGVYWPSFQTYQTKGLVAGDVALGVEADAAEHGVEFARAQGVGHRFGLERARLLDRLRPDLQSCVRFKRRSRAAG